MIVVISDVVIDIGSLKEVCKKKNNKYGIDNVFEKYDFYRISRPSYHLSNDNNSTLVCICVLYASVYDTQAVSIENLMQ